MKRCCRCRVEQPLEKFNRHRSEPDGRQKTCKGCNQVKHRLRTYGVTDEWYRAKYAELEGNCPLCGRWYKDLVIDHDHQTGKVRGLLCIACNRTLGYIENEDWVDKACNYLGVMYVL